MTMHVRTADNPILARHRATLRFITRTLHNWERPPQEIISIFFFSVTFPDINFHDALNGPSIIQEDTRKFPFRRGPRSARLDYEFMCLHPSSITGHTTALRCWFCVICAELKGYQWSRKFWQVKSLVASTRATWRIFIFIKDSLPRMILNVLALFAHSLSCGFLWKWQLGSGQTKNITWARLHLTWIYWGTN